MISKQKTSPKWGWTRFFALLGVMVLLMGTFVVGNAAYRVFRENLVAGQVPLAWTAAIVPGPTVVKGTVEPRHGTLVGPFSGQQCLYYRKKVEVEETDSDGDTSWRTVEDTFRAVVMNVVDQTGKVAVQPTSAQFRAKRVHRHKRGRHRYTEWAIRPGDPTFVLGDYVGESIGYSSTLPLVISNLGEREYRASKGSSAAYLCIVAVAMATFLICLICIVFGWHHVAVYLGLIAVLVPSWMFSHWYRLVSTELTFGHQMLSNAMEHLQGEMPDTLRSALIKETLNDGVERYNSYRNKWMNRVVAGLNSQPAMSGRSLSTKEIELTRHYPTRSRPAVSINKFIGITLVIVGMLLLIFMVRLGFYRLKTKRLIENIPTYPTAGVVVGLTEVKGSAVKEVTWLTSRYANEQCCWYRYEKKQKQGTGKDSSWVTIASGEKSTPFILKDANGTIPVDPSKAKVTGRRVFHERSGNIIRTEWAVNEEEQLYVLGPAGLKDADDAFLTIKHQEDERFLISVESERTIMLRFAAAGFVLLNLSLIGGTTAILAFLSMGRFSAFDFFLSALFPPLYLVGLVIAFLYNDLIFLRERMRRSLAMIDVALKKRSDLVPQLVSVVKGYLQHEKDMLESITRMRTRPADSMKDRQQSETLHETGTQTFLATLERYPDLKANQVAVDLQNRLTTLENEIAFARASYNDAVERYNTRIASVPEVILAKIFRFQLANSFQTADRQAVKVSL